MQASSGNSHAGAEDIVARVAAFRLAGVDGSEGATRGAAGRQRP
jgi:hypothetical protein